MEASWSLTNRLVQLTGDVPLDVLLVEQFETHGSELDADKATDLFWNVVRPTVISGLGSSGKVKVQEAPPLPDDIEEVLLEKLGKLEEDFRVPYQPDVDQWTIADSLFIYAYIAAARALRLKRKVGYSDDVRQSLEGVLQVVRRLGMNPVFASGGPFGIVSIGALTGLVSLEAFRIKRLDASYGEALHLLAEGLRYIAYARSDTEEPLDWIEQEFPDNVADERQWRSRLNEYLQTIDVNAQETADAFEAIRSRGKCDDWKQVVEDCKALAEFWNLCGKDQQEWAPGPDNTIIITTKNDQLVTDAQGKEWTWLEFWRRAQGWAEAQLSPSELRELLNQREDEAAEERLRAYFFGGDLWYQLSERAQRSLADADRAWHSARAGRIEAVLNDLQVATESLCYTFVWEGLRAAKGKQSLLEFVNRDAELQERRHQPTLADYAWACRQPFFKEFITAPNLTGTERDFLARELPNALNGLRKLRDAAQHDPKRTWRREEVAPFVREFLGIGQQGVLPTLAEICRKVSPQIRRRIAKSG